MALWGDTDTLADAPKFEAPTLTFDGSSTDVVSATNDTLTLAGHGLATGEPLTYTAANTAIAGLTDATVYYTIRVDADTIKLAASLSHANAGTPVIDITGVADDTGDTLQVTPSDIYFVDVTEAGVVDNKQIGLGTGGWNKYSTYTDSDGATRHRAEVLVAMRQTAAEAGDVGVDGADDAVVADTAS